MIAHTIKQRHILEEKAEQEERAAKKQDFCFYTFVLFLISFHFCFVLGQPVARSRSAAASQQQHQLFTQQLPRVSWPAGCITHGTG